MANETEDSGKTTDTTPAKSELPKVESPPLSPATEPAAEPVATTDPAIDIAAVAKRASPSRIGVRYRRNAMLAASVAIAAAFGAGIGALATGGFGAPAHVDVAGVEETNAMRQSLSQLGKEITTLKANIDASNKAAHSQIAKISERFDRGQQDITGSISAPQTAPAVTPVPSPRPAPRIAALDAQPTARPPLVLSWTIRNARDGVVYVENHGEVYQVSLGAPLPGLGPVEAVRRQDGRWMVVTPKGIIVSMRDRRYFEQF